MGWNRINLTGDYVWHANERVARAQFGRAAHSQISQVDFDSFTYKKIHFS